MKFSLIWILAGCFFVIAACSFWDKSLTVRGVRCGESFVCEDCDVVVHCNELKVTDEGGEIVDYTLDNGVKSDISCAVEITVGNAELSASTMQNVGIISGRDSIQGEIRIDLMPQHSYVEILPVCTIVE